MMNTQNDHPILSALAKAGYKEDGEDIDDVIPATGGEPWNPQASWPTLAAKNDPNHMEVTEEAVKCYKLNEDEDIVDDRLYINGEGRPVKTQMDKIQEEVLALKGKPLPGVALEDVEIISASFAGTLLGLILVGIIIYYTLNFAFTNRIDGPYKNIKIGDTSVYTLWNRFVDMMTRWFCPPSVSS